MNSEQIKKNMLKGSPARLFPVLPESKKEERATSMLLSVFTMVPDFARAVLEEAGAPIGKQSKISCYTEVSFKGMNASSRPDGLIIVENSRGPWVALVESKICSSEITEEQLTSYIDIAKAQGFDAVITISNQFAGDPSHHPLALGKSKKKGVGLFHFSWLAIASKALLLRNSKLVDDVEQSFLLSELLRYMQSDKTGMEDKLTMSKAWKNVFEEIHQGHAVPKASQEARDASSDWFQLLRFISIKLSLAVGEACSIHIVKKHMDDANIRLQDTICGLHKTQSFTGELKIPNAASRIRMTASIARKTLDLSVRIDTPKDVKQQRASINFVLSQLKDCETEGVEVVVNWPRTSYSTKLLLSKALDDDHRKELLRPDLKALPTSIDIVKVIDIGARMKTSKHLPEVAELEVERFYEEIVQNLRKWVPKAPKLKNSAHVLDEDVAAEEKTTPSPSAPSLMAGETELPYTAFKWPVHENWKSLN
jgi:hypothetical protein